MLIAVSHLQAFFLLVAFDEVDLPKSVCSLSVSSANPKVFAVHQCLQGICKILHWQGTGRVLMEEAKREKNGR